MKMGVATYYRYKKKVEDMKLERMQFIAKHFQELHLEKIDRLELIDRLMWQEYEKETQPFRRVKILETIANAQINVSSYYESTTVALEVSNRFNNGNGKGNGEVQSVMSFEDWKSENIRPRISDDSYYSEEENGKYYWELHKKYNEYVKDWKTRMFGPDSEEQSKIESEAWANADADADADAVAWK